MTTTLIQNRLIRKLQILMIIVTIVFGNIIAAQKVQAQVTKYEAEDAILADGAGINTDHLDYSGTGFVDGFGNEGASATFTVNVAATGGREIILRYANGDPESTLSLYINDVKIEQMKMPQTGTGEGNWDKWGDKIIIEKLNEGENSIKFKYDPEDHARVNLDYITVSDEVVDIPIPPGTLYEAENETLEGGAAINNNNPNYSGEGFVEGFWNVGASVTFTVNVDVAGGRKVTLRYANGDPESYMTIYVNGVKAQRIFTVGTGDWSTWGNVTVSLNLKAGENLIKYIREEGDPGAENLDYISVSDAVVPIDDPGPQPDLYTIDDATTGTGENQYEFVGETWGAGTNPLAYMKTDHYNNVTDDYYLVRFSGIQVKVYGEMNNSFGIVAISIDGGEETFVDCYNADRFVDTLLYTSSELSDASHTLKVRITGTKNEASAATWHTADRVVYTPAPAPEPEPNTIDDATTGTGINQYEFVGTWGTSTPATAYMKTDHYSGTEDSYYQVRFNGVQAMVYGEMNNAFGIIAISVDGGEETLVDCYSAEKVGNTLLFTTPELTNDNHIIKVRVTGTKNENSASTFTTADRVVYIPGPVTDVNTIDDATTGTGENQYEFVGTWGTSTPETAYMQTDHYSGTTDSYYQVRFTGIQAMVYGEMNNAFGIIAISVDGGEETLVDCYSAEKVGNTLLYTTPVLTDGSHIIKVRVTGTKNESSASTYTTADRVVFITSGVTIDDATTGTGENQYEFVGTWGTSTPETAYMQTDHYSGTTDSYYQVRFNGIQAMVYGEKNNAFGIIAISVDGGEETLVDCYSAEKVGNTLLYTSPVLAKGSHIIKVRVTGTKNEASASTYTTADRVVYIPAPIPEPNTIDDATTGIDEYQYEFVGTWGTSTPATAYMQTDHYSGTTDSYYQVRFNGIQAMVYGEKNNAFGIIAISIDGGEETLVDCYSAEKIGNTLLYTSPELTNGSHIIKVRVTGTKNEASASTYTTADRVVIVKGTTAIKDLSNNIEFSVYPNPSNGRISLNSSNEIKALEIYSVSGRKVFMLNNINQDKVEDLDISAITNGIYIVRLFDGKNYFSKKLIIRKD